MSTRQNRPEYLYFSPTWVSLVGIAAAIAVGAISGFAVIQIWPEIDIFAQRLRPAAVATIEPARVYAVPEPAVTPRPATSSNTTEAGVSAIGSPSKAQAVNPQIAPIDRRVKGAAFWAAQKARVEAITALVHERWARIGKGAESELGVPAPSEADALTRRSYGMTDGTLARRFHGQGGPHAGLNQRAR